MKLVIAGSRSITDYSIVWPAIDRAVYQFGMPTEVVSGTAAGVDRLGERWAYMRGIPVKRFPANWRAFGHGAGHIRNREMAEYADAAVVVWDGKSRGSADMIRAAQLRGLKLTVHSTSGDTKND